jgi:hypothetical protein
MAITLEDLDRRVTALEKGAEREKTIEPAVADIVSESEQRIRAEMKTERQRLTVQVSSSERRMVEILNDRFDAVMVALDRLQCPPKNRPCRG